MPGFARSISQRLTRRRRRNNVENGSTSSPQPPPPPAQDVLALASSTTTVPTNKPGILTRGMDRIRKSLRLPGRRREQGMNELVRSEIDRDKDRHGGPNGGGTNPSTGGPDAWHPDEGAVRAGLCTFQVKYLGSVEVFESRGMQVCEGALKMLKAQNKTPIKAVLHVSGDGLRLVDQQNHRGLIVDQTIEKVSFCAPDRNNSRGFAYICREGSSRRWMCHGFLSLHESGERLSHAVGCAFAVCLEKKKKRDEDNTVSAEKALNPNWDTATGSVPSSINGMDRTNAAYSSFRRQPIEERLRDPQGSIVPLSPNGRPSSLNTSKLPPPSIAKPRPSSNPSLFERQGSLRAPANDATNQQFKRQFSLRNYEKPYATQSSCIMEETITEGDESGLLLPELASLVPQQQPQIAATHPISSPTPIVAWGGGGSSSTPSNGIQLVSTGFTPSNDVSVNTLWSAHSSPPSSSRSKADEWLSSTLQQSLSINDTPPSTTPQGMSPRMMTSSNSDSPLNGSMVPPPSHPPPPLPPPSILASPDRTVGERLFERQEENINPSWITSNGSNGTIRKSPFPTVFSPDEPFVPSSFPHTSSSSSYIPSSSHTVSNPQCIDPFDVQWSRLALSSNGGKV